MMQERRQVVLENLIYLIIWMILFVAPILGFKYSSNTTVEWTEVFRSWKMVAPFFVLFVFNNYLLVPLLLLRKRTWLYLLSVIVLMGIIFLLNPYQVRIPADRGWLPMQQSLQLREHPGHFQRGEQWDEFPSGETPPFQRDNAPIVRQKASQAENQAEEQSKIRPEEQSKKQSEEQSKIRPEEQLKNQAEEQLKIRLEEQSKNQADTVDGQSVMQHTEPQPLSPSAMQGQGRRFDFQSGKRRDTDEFRPVMHRNPALRDPFFFFMSPLLKFLMMAVLVVGLNIAIKLMFRLIREGQRMKDLEKQTLQTELEYLKHQINPHFFMNTLNNIHALIDIDTEKAKETVLDLSKMMRYVLYDTEQTTLPLEKEIRFLTNYIDLMKLRYTDQVDIRIHFPEEIPCVQIPPLLFISFLENAFKHGVSYQQKSYISLSIEVVDNRLECRVENSKGSSYQAQQDSGIGLENVKTRLRLLYGDEYTLTIRDEKDEYKIILIIPV